ncbi:hypothetical protein HUB94_17165 [Paenibacillus cellulosilyticus]|nr:hypothetical protein [Paenibacillus cellulosilyticus]QKS45981.1 hypothetical protein HUB94_17165 [Paenibacillus cellulosilyticus]
MSQDTAQSPYHSDTDYQYFFHSQGRGQGIAASADGYYILNGSYLYYMDKQNMEPILLDNNPNNDCTPNSAAHVPRNCNAFVQTDAELVATATITYYKNNLYLVERIERTDKDALMNKQYALIRMDKDGTNRKVLRKFDAPPYPVVIHRDQIYYVNNLMTVDQVAKPSVVSVPLANPDKEPVILYTLGPDDSVNDLIAYGNMLYVMDYGNNMFRTIGYDINTHETTVLFTDDKGNLSISGIPEIGLSHQFKGGVAIYGIYGSRLYSNIFPGDQTDPASWRIYNSDLGGQDVSIVPVNLPLVSWAYADQRYFYLNPVSWLIKSPDYADVAQEMVVYDLNYKEVNRVDISMLTNYSKGLVGDDRYMFFQATETGDSDTQRTYVLDKSQLNVRGGAELKLLMETAVYATN